MINPNTMKSHKSWHALVRATAVLSDIVSLLMGLSSPLQAAQSVSLAWDTESGVAGYRLHYGTASGIYTQTVDVGDTTTATVSSLTPGLTYYFVVTAYNVAGLESLPSNQVSFLATANAGAPAHPVISAIQSVANGAVQLTVTDSVGQTDSIYTSSDLQSWMLLTTAVNRTGTLTVDDPRAAGTNQRFYRASDATVSSDPVGFVTLPIAGAPSGEARAFSFLGINLLNPVNYQGTITSFGSYFVTDRNANWTADEFNGANGNFFLEVISGPYAGLMTDILTTAVPGNTLTIADDLSSLLAGGELYRIRKHRTLGDVFGESNENGLNGGATVAEGDEVRVLDAATQTFSTYYFKTGGFGGVGWRADADAVTDASGTILYPDQGLLIVRKVAGDLGLILTGTVKTGPTVVQVESNLNLLANVYPAGTVTLGSSGLYTGDSETGLAGGTATTADQILLFDPASDSYYIYYYKTSGLGGTGWRSVRSNSIDASNVNIPAARAFFINRRENRAPFLWTVPQPY
jgi:uncharacterized protein (TIGR02597 family)